MGKYLFFILIFLLNPAYSQKSMLNDLDTYEIIQKGLDKTYNFEFDQAIHYYEKVRQKYPGHPAYNFLMASSLYWEMLYHDNYKEKSDDYFGFLNKALEQTNKFLEKNSKDVEGIFFNMAIESSMALYYSERGETMKALNHAKKAYSGMKEGFTLKEKFIDFYFSTGLYDYYVVQYPETHPVYKPFMFFFTKGNKERGLQELQYASEKGVFSSTESLHYLANIYLKYEDVPSKAVTYTEQLVKKYPNNYYFITRHLEGLIATGKYKESEFLAYKLYKTEKKPFIMRSFVFYGMLYEKHYKNYEEALTYYQAAIRNAQQLSQPTHDWQAYANAGIARIYHSKGDKAKAIEYYKKVKELADYTSLRREAKEYLDKHN